MNQLPKSLTIAGFQHTQIDRDGDIALYRQSKPGQHDAFEVIIVQSHEAAKIPNGDGTFREVEAGETYPKATSWGRNGWTYGQESFARAKFRDLIAHREAQNQDTPQQS